MKLTKVVNLEYENYKKFCSFWNIKESHFNSLNLFMFCKRHKKASC